MFLRAGTARGDHRNFYSVGDGPGKLQVIACFGSVTIHTGEQYLAGAQCFCLCGPLHRIDVHVHPAAVFVHIPAASVRSALCIDRHHNTLAAELVRCTADQLRVHQRCRVDRDFIGAFAQQKPEVLHCADPAADRERDEHLLGYPLYQIHDRIAPVRRGSDVQKYNLISPCFIIGLRDLYRISGIPQGNKIYSLYHSSVLHVQAGNDPLGEHLRLLPIFMKNTISEFLILFLCAAMHTCAPQHSPL